MAKPTHVRDTTLATRDDLRRILGDIDDGQTLEILALRPTLVEVEEAAVLMAGDRDVLAKSGHPVVGCAAEIFDILSADEEEERPPAG